MSSVSISACQISPRRIAETISRVCMRIRFPPPLPPLSLPRSAAIPAFPFLAFTYCLSLFVFARQTRHIGCRLRSNGGGSKWHVIGGATSAEFAQPCMTRPNNNNINNNETAKSNLETGRIATFNGGGPHCCRAKIVQPYLPGDTVCTTN